MKKITILLIAIALVNTASHAQLNQLTRRMAERKTNKPAIENKGPEPDYSSSYFWAASPYKQDPSDSVPAFLKEERRDTLADVFYIHPTTYITDKPGESFVKGMNEQSGKFAQGLRNTAPNANLADAALNNATDMRPLLNQASVFNGSCRVFAPRYRQASLKAFFAPRSAASVKAFDLAYADIKKAFQYYLEHDNHGRPIIIASHSQGSMHAIRLLQEFFDGEPLQKQLVCAYVVGWQIQRDAFKYIPLGDSPTATGCVVGWRTYQKGETPPLVQRENGNSLCVNPLTWTASITQASKDLNEGSLIHFNQLFPHEVGAEVAQGLNILWAELPANMGEETKRMKNLHILDYQLFWMNIRENVKQRVKAFTKGLNQN